MTGWGIALLIIAILLLLGAIGFIIYAQFRAGRLDFLLPQNLRNQSAYRPPAPAPKGIKNWAADIWHNIRNTRSSGGAYESTSYGGPRGGARDRTGFGPLDPDGAWDTRVDHEADFAGNYYEEQELGDTTHGPYGGSGYGEVGVGGIPDGRGRSRSRQRELDSRYDEEMHAGGAAANPFNDSNALRAASPRPVGDAARGQRGPSTHKKQQNSLGTDESPTERKSMFREQM